MPATSPRLSDRQAHHLARLGARIKARRKSLGLSAALRAESAGISRVTLHRIEAGNAAVTIGSYLNVTWALDLNLTIPLPIPTTEGTVVIRVEDYPGLRSLAWQVQAGTELTEAEALNVYERGWRHLDKDTLTDRERLFIQHLADAYSHGALLV